MGFGVQGSRGTEVAVNPPTTPQDRCEGLGLLGFRIKGFGVSGHLLPVEL